MLRSKTTVITSFGDLGDVVLLGQWEKWIPLGDALVDIPSRCATYFQPLPLPPPPTPGPKVILVVPQNGITCIPTHFVVEAHGDVVWLTGFRSVAKIQC